MDSIFALHSYILLVFLPKILTPVLFIGSLRLDVARRAPNTVLAPLLVLVTPRLDSQAFALVAATLVLKPDLVRWFRMS